jgi:hypothetical protein
MSTFDPEIDRLYQLLPDEFTAARNDLARRLKAGGDAEGAAEVKGLARPSVSAWAVNQLYWRVRPDFDAVVAAGGRMRAAQQRMLAGKKATDFAALSTARDEAIARALKSIEGLAARAGVEMSAVIRQRVRTTLESLAIQGGWGDQARAGRFESDLALPGFETLASLAAALPPPTRSSETAGRTSERSRRAGTDRESAKRQALETARQRARTALASAESDARAARDAAERASAAAADAERRAGRAREDVDLVKGQLADAMARATRALDALKNAKRSAALAHAESHRAEEALRAARVALAAVDRRK